ncbi:winged helix-turn-helix transcriptional regulator [Nocardia australiensis]|uniref:winged helix-turn-helix transcriptional regulator n=1 Tax=Nocardia australiensis TaxID=2887191 RepID=UPI001D15CD52|nr:helix-turn-helix domain-containing protein [Nocardia australiensis]
MAYQTVGYGDSILAHGCPSPVQQHKPDCPVDTTLDVLRGRWTALILAQFLHADLTYSELSTALPALSDKVLSDRLGHLTKAGVLHRDRTAGWPPRVQYGFTGRGRALIPVLEALWAWGAEAQ